MTDTEQPESLRLADRLQNAVATYPQVSEDEPGGYCQEVDQVMDEAAAELRRQDARIAELEAELEAVGAGGVQALSAAPGEQFDSEGFRAWVLRNLPDDTIIGSSAWWADHLTAWANRFVSAAPQPAVQQGDALPREDFAWLVVQEACETEPADEDDPECIRILRRDLKSAVLSAFLRHDAAHPAASVAPGDAEDAARSQAKEGA